MVYSVNIELEEEFEDELLQVHKKIIEEKGFSSDLYVFSEFVFLVGLKLINNPLIYDMI